MKKILLPLGFSISILNAATPMVNTSMSTDNGGTKSAIDAYSDGGGVMINTKIGDTPIDNSAMNSLVFKYGQAAKNDSTTLKQEISIISTTATAIEKTLATSTDKAKTIVNPPVDGSTCDDGNPSTSNDKWTNGVCAGTFIDGTVCNDNNPMTYGDKYTGGVCSGTYGLSCKVIKTAVPSSTDGIYTIDPDGIGGTAQFAAYCDMTTDGGGWTMYYTTSNYYHLADSIGNSIAYGSDGYSRDLRSLPFKDIIYVRHSDNQKDWFKIDSGVNITVKQFISSGVLNVSGSAIGTLTGGGGANQGYKYQLTIGDKTWMQIGLMVSGYTAGCYKVPGDWCGDTSSNYYRINGEGNGVNELNKYHGVAFRENGHLNVANKLMSVGIR